MKKIDLKPIFDEMKRSITHRVEHFFVKFKHLKKKIREFEQSSEKNRKKVRLYKILITVFLVFFVFSLGRSAVSQIIASKNAKKERIIPVYVSVVEPKNVTEQFKINGNIMAENSVMIVPDIGGKLIRYTVEVGDTVQRGQIVAYIDPSKPGTSYNLSPVSAPLSGVISALPIELGNTVTTTSIVAQMGDLSQLKIETYIPERFVEMIHLQDMASVFSTAFPGKVFKAEIYEMGPTLDPTTRTRLVKLRVTEGKDQLLSGMFAELLIDSRTISNALTVPASAIVTKSGKDYVYVVSGESGTQSSKSAAKKILAENKDARDPRVFDPGYYSGRSKMKEVKIGVQVGSDLVIESGVETGDQVVFSGQGLLSEGSLAKIMPIEPVDVTMAPQDVMNNKEQEKEVSEAQEDIQENAPAANPSNEVPENTVLAEDSMEVTIEEAPTITEPKETSKQVPPKINDMDKPQPKQTQASEEIIDVSVLETSDDASTKKQE